MARSAPAVDRFRSGYDVGPDGCWTWRGCPSASHPHFFVDGHHVPVYRWSYEHLVGPIPEGLTIDHLCRNSRCVNPDHLEPVTRGVNTIRGDTVTARNAAKSHCPQGHPYDEANTVRTKAGRMCRICKNVRNTAYQRARRLREAS